MSCYQTIQMPLDLGREIVVDLFAGGGGASCGIEQGIGRPVDVAVNHDPLAVAMHEINHPNTRHFCESVFKVSPIDATGNLPVGLLWLSPDCTTTARQKAVNRYRTSAGALRGLVLSGPAGAGRE